MTFWEISILFMFIDGSSLAMLTDGNFKTFDECNKEALFLAEQELPSETMNGILIKCVKTYDI